MKLACQTFNTDKQGPWLVWLHGLLGSGSEWQPVINDCNQYPSLVIDLPGHGNSADITLTDGFAEMNRLLGETLLACQIHDYWLLGYSLGGRIAMYHAVQAYKTQAKAMQIAPQGLKGILVEGGNPGLLSQKERDARLLHDEHWAQRFRTEPISVVLADWYQQPVFVDLSPAQRLRLIHLRSQNRGSSIADMLENTSLGHQSCLLTELQEMTLPFIYLCGEQDQKFKQIAQQYALPLKIISQAGHNVHSSNPAGFSAAVNHFLSLFG
ncbi:2-succinyl-6-hydroxy-2,4-cyclohexadiene-1-carboxylate synthase [Xenorhabdus innexi]|uniref:2-succinyl-6-hydroxy-2,4-cyclohexadiene-1-carboxylate synthase n=1 Tax=Xenorhabdus innexi TaxID=290109 RepID=A0A1N6MW23_9GAMM|nr:2-succinyl-6-hydroxy-2,4-cyclohexadiene-1-carboxylate synthase [Xenorhabdus innexi]PHM37542.1 2-succinyl-6-hydroxy-2, 4-cyclohexadiene-1-carboxylate synthase [Xenorhabdus innexi]SIP72974.1 2-succinyl-6-hydroxy-2, 4-cyclohexadiene-1-carboxylate synthase [Xenorhabdus innexi]